MMAEPNSLIRGHDISDICRNLLPDREDTALLNKLKTLVGHDNVKLARTSEEWFKLGGVIDVDGNPISNDLIEWVERTYIECGQNIQTMIDHILDEQFIATKIAGKTLYYVVNIGLRAEDFILVEIEKVQEKSDRLLLSEDNLPESVEDIIDPFQPEHIDSFNVGPASYQYRRKTDIALFMQSLAEHHTEKHPVQRFIDDWNKSSASKSMFSDDWLIRPRQHIGRYGEQLLNAELINLREKPLSQIEDIIGKHGSSLNTILKRYDRKAGYDFAWYFYMVTGKLSSRSAEAVYEDITGDFAYLPKTDENVLRTWMTNPYYIS